MFVRKFEISDKGKSTSEKPTVWSLKLLNLSQVEPLCLGWSFRNAE